MNGRCFRDSFRDSRGLPDDFLHCLDPYLCNPGSERGDKLQSFIEKTMKILNYRFSRGGVRAFNLYPMHTYGLELLFFLSWWRQKSAVVVLQSYSSSSPRAFFRFSAPLTCASKGRERDAFVFVVDTSQDIFFFPFFLFSIVDTCQPIYKVRKPDFLNY